MYIVIVNWNTGDLLAKCLQSLVDLPETDRFLINEVFVVDNASSDKSVVKAEVVVGRSINQPRVRFIKETINHGFAAGNNVALRRILDGDEDEHVLLLNPDTEVRAGALPALLDVLKEKNDVGIVGSKLLNPDGSVQGSVRPFPKLGDFVLYALKLGRARQIQQEKSFDYSQPAYVDQVMGAVFLIRRETMQQVGLLDEGFFLWFEEVDYCWQALKQGWKTYFTPRAEVIHAQGVSFSQLLGLKKTKPWLKSSLYYANKNFGVGAYLLLIMMAPLSILLTIPASLWHKRVRLKKAKYL